MANIHMAEDMAESALARGLAALQRNPDFGLQGSAAEKTIERPFLDDEGQEVARGVLTFDAATAERLGLPLSVNNLQGDTATQTPEGALVPRHSVYLAGVGLCRGSRRTVVAVAHVPRYRYVIASSGPITSRGGLLVAAVADPSDAYGGVSRIPRNKLRPGHLATNGRDQGEERALTLGGESVVTGDARSVGGARLEGKARVEGELATYADPTDIPRIDLSTYDPAGKAGLLELDQESYSGQELEGFVRRQGNLSLTSEGLRLKGAVLYVDGDLVVNGGIHGKGAVICTGKVTVRGGSTLTSENVVALLAGGDVAVGGNSRESSFFQGLIYTEGDFVAQNITLLGSFIANGQTERGSRMEMNQVNLVYAPQMTEISFEYPFTRTASSFQGRVVGVELKCLPTLDELYDPATDRYRADRLRLSWMIGDRPRTRQEAVDYLNRTSAPRPRPGAGPRRWRRPRRSSSKSSRRSWQP